MLLKILKNKYYLFFIFVLIISFFVPFISVPYFYKYQYIGSADFLSPIDQKNVFYTNLFVYNPFLYGGSNTGWHFAKLFPEIFLFMTLGYLGLNPSTVTLIYISLIILLSELSMFYFLIYVFTNKLNVITDRKYFFSIIGSLF